MERVADHLEEQPDQVNGSQPSDAGRSSCSRTSNAGSSHCRVRHARLARRLTALSTYRDMETEAAEALGTSRRHLLVDP
jgi:hypothetical protein